MAEPACWRCGGEPHQFTGRQPRRPVCAACALLLLQKALDDGEAEDTEESVLAALNYPEGNG